MKAARHISVSILIVVCLAALYGSYYMITDPSGESLGLPEGLLIDTIFSNYAVIGWILFYTVGIFSLIVILSVLLRSVAFPFLVMLQGAKICVFTFIQLLLIGRVFWIQYAFILAGIALIVLGIFQNQKKIISESNNKDAEIL